MSLKVDITYDHSMRIRFPARSWEHAHDVIESLKEHPPSGYRLIESQVKPRGVAKSGRRCNVKLQFNHIDDRVTPLSKQSAADLFYPYLLRAQGVTE